MSIVLKWPIQPDIPCSIPPSPLPIHHLKEWGFILSSFLDNHAILWSHDSNIFNFIYFLFFKKKQLQLQKTKQGKKINLFSFLLLLLRFHYHRLQGHLVKVINPPFLLYLGNNDPVIAD